MKADPAAQRRLLDLADIDAELDRIHHRRRTMPEVAEITSAEGELRARRDDVIAVDTSIGDLDREVKKLEAEIEGVRAREDRDRELLKTGVGSRQVTDLEHELQTLQRRQQVLEDELLDVMEQREATGVNADQVRAALVAAQDQLADARSRHDQTLADLDMAQQRATAQRAAVAAELPDDLLALYDRIRAQKGAGAALLRARRCQACRLELDLSALNALRDAPAQQVLRCEECGVILVRTDESGL